MCQGLRGEASFAEECSRTIRVSERSLRRYRHRHVPELLDRWLGKAPAGRLPMDPPGATDCGLPCDRDRMCHRLALAALAHRHSKRGDSMTFTRKPGP